MAGRRKFNRYPGNPFFNRKEAAMNSAHETQAAKERVIRNFKAVVVDTEELLKATANQTGDRIAAARARMDRDHLSSRP
jgi:ElaB/YqjD/DUF883 family membrane-anchored ribosome-binding protein